MSNLFGGQKGAEHIQKRDIMKEDFGWEIPYESIPLPSNGAVYPPSSILHNMKTVQIKAMTAKEEDILASQAFIKEGTVIDHLIRSCLVDKNINPSELTLGDRNAILVAIRITGYGTDYPVTTRCKFCNAFHEENIILSDLRIKRLEIQPDQDSQNLFSYTLPVTKKKVQFSFINSIKEKEKQQKIETLEKSGLGIAGEVTTNLEHVVHSIAGITDKTKIKHFIMNMPALDAKSLRKFIRENEPGIEMKFNYKCKNCGSLNEDISLPILTNFFWPA